VRQVAQYEQALFDDRVAFLSLDVGDKTDPASVMLVGRIVKALSLWHTCTVHRNSP
jgi:hypothetical protein